MQGKSEEYIPLREYLLRHDKAIFWVIESMIPFGNHPLFLFFLGWMLPPKPAFMKLTTTPVGKTAKRKYVHGRTQCATSHFLFSSCDDFHEAGLPRHRSPHEQVGLDRIKQLEQALILK